MTIIIQNNNQRAAQTEAKQDGRDSMRYWQVVTRALPIAVHPEDASEGIGEE